MMKLTPDDAVSQWLIPEEVNQHKKAGD